MSNVYILGQGMSSDCEIYSMKKKQGVDLKAGDVVKIGSPVAPSKFSEVDKISAKTDGIFGVVGMLSESNLNNEFLPIVVSGRVVARLPDSLFTNVGVGKPFEEVKDCCCKCKVVLSKIKCREEGKDVAIDGVELSL